MAQQQREENIPVPDPSLLTTEQLNREIGALKELIKSQNDLVNEKFIGINARLNDSKQAVEKAFESSEKAIGKTETAFTKQIEASDSRIADVKDRLTILESRTQGKTEGITSVGAMVLGAIASFSVLISAATLLYNIFSRR